MAEASELTQFVLAVIKWSFRVKSMTVSALSLIRTWVPDIFCVFLTEADQVDPLQLMGCSYPR